MAAAASFPTLSQVQTLDTAYLPEAADHWTRTADLWEQAFAEIHTRMSAPGGFRWEGQAAASAQEVSYLDLVKVRGASDQLHQAAAIVRRGEEQLQACKEGVLEAVHAARADGFDVGEDYSVTDRSEGGSAELRAARQAAAQGHAGFIRHRVAALVASDQQLTTQIAAATEGIDSLTFQEASGIDDTIVGDDKHHGVQAVDNSGKKRTAPTHPTRPAARPLAAHQQRPRRKECAGPPAERGKRDANGVGTRPDIKELWDTASIKRMWDYLTRNATDSPGAPNYDGVTRVLPDGTQIGLRQSSDGWGDTLDVWYPDGSYEKIHTPYAPPLISAPPRQPPAAQPAPLPLPPPQAGHPLVVLPPTQVVDPATLPPWLQNPSPPGIQVTPGAPLPFAPLDTPDAPAVPAPSATPGPTPSPGESSLLPDLAHDLAEAGKDAGGGVLAGIAIIGGVIAGGVTSSGQIAR
jgi:hypothetical protein